MTDTIRKLVRGAQVALIAGAFLFAGGQLATGVGAPDSCTGPGEIGTCPPFTNQTCNETCVDKFGSPGGKCDLTGCCKCAI
jgi:hypothetical protein